MFLHHICWIFALNLLFFIWIFRIISPSLHTCASLKRGATTQLQNIHHQTSLTSAITDSVKMLPQGYLFYFFIYIFLPMLFLFYLQIICLRRPDERDSNIWSNFDPSSACYYTLNNAGTQTELSCCNFLRNCDYASENIEIGFFFTFYLFI